MVVGNARHPCFMMGLQDTRLLILHINRVYLSTSTHPAEGSERTSACKAINPLMSNARLQDLASSVLTL